MDVEMSDAHVQEQDLLTAAHEYETCHTLFTLAHDTVLSHVKHGELIVTQIAASEETLRSL